MPKDSGHADALMPRRNAAVAGMFYPAEPQQLRRQVETLLAHAPAPAGPAPKALILPHAGYPYSGPIAAAGCRCLEPVAEQIERVVLFGPAHRVYLDGLAVPSVASFDTPLGQVPLDRALIDELATLPGVCVSDIAHRDEHSLEVELPFLQVVLGEFHLVPLVVGRAAPETVAAVVDAAWGGPETLIVVSSDLSHYLGYAQAQRADAATCRAILDKATSLSGEQACGAHAINGLMQASHACGLMVNEVARCNSGDTSGDKHRVVGYGAFVLH